MRIVKRKSRAKAVELKSLLEKQEYRCALSGVELTPETASIDHIVPVSAGGCDDIDNLQWVHSKVNKAKSTMSNEDFVNMCKSVSAWMS